MKNKELEKIIDDMHLRFTSGNAIEVERAYIRKEEWTKLCQFLIAEDGRNAEQKSQ